MPPGNSLDKRDEFQALGLVKDEDWLPVARMLKTMPNLKDLSFNAQNDVFPACLLDTIHEHLPYCRISIRQFYLSADEKSRANSSTSDDGEVDDDDEVVDEDEVDDEDDASDEDEFEDEIAWGSPLRPAPNLRNVALVRSPNLHDIHFQLGDFLFESFGFEAALAMVGGISPNIKAVHMTRCKPSLEYSKPLARNWAGVKDLTAPPKLARLNTLALFDSSTLIRWNGIIDASALRSLSLGYQQCIPRATPYGWPNMPAFPT